VPDVGRKKRKNNQLVISLMHYTIFHTVNFQVSETANFKIYQTLQNCKRKDLNFMENDARILNLCTAVSVDRKLKILIKKLFKNLNCTCTCISYDQ
jgi:hypothetical protein